jgi:hypothetical protein
MSLSYLCADGHKQAVTHIRESRRFESMYILQGKLDQHAMRISCSVYVWSRTIRISHGQRIATFRESLIDLDGSHYSQEKGILDYIPSMPADRSVGSHPVSLPLSTKKIVDLSQASIDDKLLGLLGPYTSMRLVHSILACGGQPIGP